MPSDKREATIREADSATAKEVAMQSGIAAGFDVHFRNFRIQNLVASSAVPGLLNLDEMSRDYGACCGYEPDLFPGLVMRIKSPKVVFLCFRSTIVNNHWFCCVFARQC